MGISCTNNEGSKGVKLNSGPPGGIPAEPSATSFVYSWVTLVAPVSTIRAW